MVLVALVVIIAIVYFAFFRNKPQSIVQPTNNTITGQLPEENISTTTPGDKPRNYQKYDISTEPTHTINQNDLSKIAMAFSERFGSYSNQSNYDNFTDLKIFMTDNMKGWADRYVSELKTSPQQDVGYYGVSTKALTSEVLQFNEANGEAEILVTTQRRESTDTVENNGSYIQKIKITMVKSDGEWLVDKAYWEK